MQMEQMFHPELPGREIDVPVSAVPHWRGSGWAPVSERPVVEEKSPPAIAEPGKSTSDRLRPKNDGSAV